MTMQRLMLPVEHMQTPLEPKRAGARPHPRPKAGRARRQAARLSNAERERHHSDATDPRKAQRNYETYLSLARAETLKGDPIAAENYLQHAEHYFRSMRANSH